VDTATIKMRGSWLIVEGKRIWMPAEEPDGFDEE